MFSVCNFWMFMINMGSVWTEFLLLLYREIFLVSRSIVWQTITLVGRFQFYTSKYQFFNPLSTVLFTSYSSHTFKNCLYHLCYKGFMPESRLKIECFKIKQRDLDTIKISYVYLNVRLHYRKLLKDPFVLFTSFK